MKPFHIDEPCSETWNAMRIEAGGRARHCASCAKHVVDLAQATQAQVRGLVALNPDGFCGRQVIRDGELVTAPEPAALRSRWQLRMGLGGAMVAGALASAACQTAVAAGPGPTPPVLTQPHPEDGTPQPPPESQPAPEPPPPPTDKPEVLMGKMAYEPPAFAASQITFAPGSAKLSKSALAALDDIAAALEANAWIPAVAINGRVAHDEIARTRYAKLAGARAAVVRDALVKRGIDAARLRLMPFDPATLVATNSSTDAARVDVRACSGAECK